MKRLANHITVLGLARSGLDVCLAASESGAHVIGLDGRSPDLSSPEGREADSLCDLRLEYAGDLPECTEVLVVSPGVRREHPLVQQAQSRGIPVWSEIEFASRMTVNPVTAITGTNAKSTTAMLTAHLLNTGGRRAVLCGNIAADEIKMTMTRAVLEARPGDVLVVEVSSYQLLFVDTLRPHAAVWTTLSPDHMDVHRDMDDYASTKARLFAQMDIDDVAVLPAGRDADDMMRYLHTGASLRRFTHLFPDARGDEDAVVADGEWVLHVQGQQVRPLFRMNQYPLIGAHNRRNLSAAVALALAFDPDWKSVERMLGSVQALPHRMELVRIYRGVSYVNNSMCTNVDAVIHSLEAIDTPYILIAGGRDKGRSAFGAWAPVLQRGCRQVLLMGEAAPVIEADLREAGWTQTRLVDDMDEAVLISRDLALPADTVILAPGCASFGQYVNFEARGEAFRHAVHRMVAMGGGEHAIE